MPLDSFTTSASPAVAEDDTDGRLREDAPDFATESDAGAGDNADDGDEGGVIDVATRDDRRERFFVEAESTDEDGNDADEAMFAEGDPLVSASCSNCFPCQYHNTLNADFSTRHKR